jgi:hypothetical protein
MKPYAEYLSRAHLDLLDPTLLSVREAEIPLYFGIKDCILLAFEEAGTSGTTGSEVATTLLSALQIAAQTRQ